MPLRDYFHPPVSTIESWDAIHFVWPTYITETLAASLPNGFVARPHGYLGREFEIDVGANDINTPDTSLSPESNGEGGVAVLTAAPPTVEIETELVDTDEFEVRVYDHRLDRRLVAVIEIISPANKDRATHRQVFVSKCAALINQRVSLVLIDLVTSRRANLYAELLALIGGNDPAPGALSAVSCRWIERGRGNVLQAWTHPLTLGQPLPTVPLWLTEDLWVSLELEGSYETTCRLFRIP